MAAAFPSRLTFPEAQPSVCVTFFTCVGTNVSGTVDLVHTYAAAVTYLEAQRSAPGGELRYELVWLDNGGSAREHEAFLRRGAQFEVARRNPTNQGLFRAVNDAWFRGAGCSAPYVLSLEDDRVARRGLERSGVAHLRLSIELLRRDPHLSHAPHRYRARCPSTAAAVCVPFVHTYYPPLPFTYDSCQSVLYSAGIPVRFVGAQ